MTRKLLCYAFGHGDRWEAICVDLDISTQGKSFRDVCDGLNDMVSSLRMRRWKIKKLPNVY